MRFREANEVIGKIKTPIMGYKALAASVIAMACDDWMRASSKGDTIRKNSIEKFFLNERFMLFSDGVDGSYVLRRLREIYEKEDPVSEARAVAMHDINGVLQNVYASAIEAAEDFHGDRRSITRACKTGRLCYGCYWGFAEK